MIAWLLINAWDIATLIVYLGPIGFYLTRLDAADRAYFYDRDFGPKTFIDKKPSKAKRWIIGVLILMVSGLFGSTMYDAAPAIYNALYKHSAF